MSSLPETFNFGDSKDMPMEELIIKLQRMYTDLARAVNAKPDLYQRQQDGQVTDTFLANGSININSSTNKVEMLTNHTSPIAVVWTTLS
jgi:hypothetical protein